VLFWFLGTPEIIFIMAKEVTLAMGPIYQINICEKIKEYRKTHKLSQSQFGKLLDVSAQAVFKWEQGICYPDITFLPRLAQILNCRVEDFFETI